MNTLPPLTRSADTYPSVSPAESSGPSSNDALASWQEASSQSIARHNREPFHERPPAAMSGKIGLDSDASGAVAGQRVKRSIDSGPAPANVENTQPEQPVNPPLDAYASTHISQFATPQQAAGKAIKTWAKDKYGLDIDPNKVVLVKFRYDKQAGTLNGDDQYYGQMRPGPPYPGQVLDSKTLVQLMLSNDQQVGDGSFADWSGDKLFPHSAAPDIVVSKQMRPGDHSVAEGIYRQDEAAIGRYDAHNRLAPHPSDFRQFVWDTDLRTPYTQSLDVFWSRHENDFRNTAKIAFLKAAELQTNEHSLSPEGKALAWKAAGLPPDKAWEDLSLTDIETQASPPADARVTQVDLFGYRSSMYQITDTRDGRTLLYTPGNSSPLHEFESEAAMKTWIAEQAKDPSKRKALAAYFLPRDETQGFFHSGVDVALEGIGTYPKPVHLAYDREGFTASGSWNPQTYINYGKPTSIQQDMFASMTQTAKEHGYAGADQIKTDARVSIERTANIVDTGMTYLGPVAIAVPELWPVFVVGGAAQAGFGIDQVVNGQTAEEKIEGGKRIVFGLLNAVPAAIAKDGKGLEIGEESKSGTFEPGSGPAPSLPASTGWNPAIYDDSASLNGLNPDKQGVYHLQGRQYVDLEGRPARINGIRSNGQPNFVNESGQPVNSNVPDVRHEGDGRWAVNRLRGGSPGDGAAINPPIPPRASIPKGPLFEGIERINSGSESNIQWQALVRGYMTEVRFDLERNAWRTADTSEYLRWDSGQKRWVLLNSTPPVASETERLEALRQFGFNELPRIDPVQAGTMEIPKDIHQIWLGEPNGLLDKRDLIAKNADIAEKAGFKIKIHVRLDDGDASSQLTAIKAQLPSSVDVVDLREEPFYAQYKQRPSYKVFSFFTTGADRNYAVAADNLRYPLMNHYGGLYMDIDDELQPGFGGSPLRTNEGDLILNRPVSNPLLSMDRSFNNSNFGTLKNNPVLSAMEDESYKRFAENPSSFTNRPRGNETAEQRKTMSEYMTDVSRTFGPKMFNDVLFRSQPKYKYILDMYRMDGRGIELPPSMRDWIARNEANLMPLDRQIQIGSDQSWTHTR